MSAARGWPCSATSRYAAARIARFPLDVVMPAFASRSGARFLAEHWSAPNAAGRLELLGDPAHKRTNPYLYRVDETVAIWRAIAAPVLLVSADAPDRWRRFVDTDEYRARLAAIPQLRQACVEQAGHMLHHDQPERVASLIEEFIDA